MAVNTRIPIDQKLALSVYAVQATNFEVSYLWQRAQDSNVEWQEVAAGFSQVVGKVDDRVVAMNVQFAVINGQWVMFYHGSSQLVDYPMIEKEAMELIGNKTSAYDPTRPAHCDASNFVHCLATIDKLNEGLRIAVV